MMWEACAEKVKQMNGQIEMGCKVIGCAYDELTSTWNLRFQDQAGNVQTLEAEHVISSAPMRELARGLSPSVSDRAKHAADSLKYRDFLTVMLILKERNMFDDNWIYIHDPSVKVGRIQNFRSWSPEMVPDPDKACYGLEYFCFENDGLWASSDAELIELAKKELMQIGLAHEGDVVDGCVVRQKKLIRFTTTIMRGTSRPFAMRSRNVIRICTWLGRNGMHKYNNQDHAMMTAMLCVENILADTKLYDLWQVNGDAEYHEAGAAPVEEAQGTALRLVPMRVEPSASATLASD